MDDFEDVLRRRNLVPAAITSADARDFMSCLAVERRVSAGTQNQAFNAILFFFRNVLGRNLQEVGKTVRARKPRRLPVVLSKTEIRRIFDGMDGTPLLAAKVIYGGGLRINECTRLRVKDLDLGQRRLTVRSGKGGKDRTTIPPESAVTELEAHLADAKALFETDRARDVPGVELPRALERKYPNAGKEWSWFWVFPGDGLSTDPRSGILRRHHSSPQPDPQEPSDDDDLYPRCGKKHARGGESS